MDLDQETYEMNATEYKKYHESFMQNNHGSSAPYVFFCIFFTVQCTVYSSLKLRNCKNNQYIYEYIIIVVPLVMAQTIFSNFIYLLNIVIMTMLLYEFYHQYPGKKSIPCQSTVKSNKIYSISVMRGLTYLITVCAILGVDFKAFPRYFAKTERHGFSLMDTGVGLFVLMSGLVHKNLGKYSLWDIVKGNLKFISILIFLGVARYFSVKQLDYQEHVTEYGVHWNFFFTLAICKLLSTVILYFNVNALIYSFIILLTHESILISGVQKWVFSDATRDNLLSANREGISSTLGYVSMYLFATNIRNVLSSKPTYLQLKLFSTISFKLNKLKAILVIGTLLLWSVLYIFNKLRPISRTLANISYCVFLEAILITVVTLLYHIETVLEDEKMILKEPKIIENINSNGLSYFLIANLMTGAINLSIRTLFVSNITTFMILNMYMILTISITVFLKRSGLKI